MFIVHVSINVKPEYLDDFIKATLHNAHNSRLESGVARFDVIQQTDDTTRFVLVEVYRSQEAAANHKQTVHYNRWREIAEPMMAEPRNRIIYKNISPEDAGW